MREKTGNNAENVSEANTLHETNLMKHIRFIIPTLLLVAAFFFSNRSFAQDYVHYATLTKHLGSVASISFSPSGMTFASASVDSTVCLWDTATGQHHQTLIGHAGLVIFVSYSPDGRTIANGGSDNTIRLWDAVTGKHKTTFYVGHTEDGLYCFSYAPDGKIFATGGFKGPVHLWDAATGKHKTTLLGHTDWVQSVSYSPDGKTIASGSMDNTVRLWDATTGHQKKTLIGHTNGVSSVVFSPHGRMLASGSSDSTIRLWDVSTGRSQVTLAKHTDRVYSVAYSPNGKIIASGSGDGKIHLWDATTGKYKSTLTTDADRIQSVVFSPDGRTIASGSQDNKIRLWKLSTSVSERSDSLTPELHADHVYNYAVRAVMWIVNPGISEGSGALLDKKFRLAVTNAHVTGKQNTIDVYFPAPDEKSELIKDRNFYLTNSGVLKQLGYYTKGHVVARNEKTDLAIIRLDGLPETTREIDWNSTTPSTKAGNLVYILGNPGGQDLWRWTLGEFLKDHGDFLHIQSDVFGGNSGGPVLNKQGVLLGIVARSDRHMNALAIPVRHISGLLSKSQLEHSRSRR